VRVAAAAGAAALVDVGNGVFGGGLKRVRR